MNRYHTDDKTKKQIERANVEYSYWQTSADEKTRAFMCEAQEHAENMIKVFNEIELRGGGFIYHNYSVIIIPHFLDKIEKKIYLDRDNSKEYIIIRYPYSKPDIESIKKAIISCMPIIGRYIMNKRFIYACNLQLSYIIANNVSFYHPEFSEINRKDFQSYLLTILSAVLNNSLIGKLYDSGVVFEYRDCYLEETENNYKKDIQLLNKAIQFDYAHYALKSAIWHYYRQVKKAPLSDKERQLLLKEELSNNEIDELLNLLYNNNYNGKLLDYCRQLQKIKKSREEEYKKFPYRKEQRDIIKIIKAFSQELRDALIDEKKVLNKDDKLTEDEENAKIIWKRYFLKDNDYIDGFRDDIFYHFANGFNNAAQNANFKDIRLAFEEISRDFYTYLEEGSNIYNFLKSISCNQLNFSHVFRFYALFIAHGEGAMKDIINGLIQDIETHYQHIQSDAIQKGLNNLKNGKNPGIGFIYELMKQAPNEEIKNFTNLILYLLEKKEIYERMKKEEDVFNFSQELENAREYYNKFEQKNGKRLVYKKDE